MLMVFFPTAMSDNESIYPRIESVYAFTKDMNDDLVFAFNNQIFTKVGAVLRMKYYNPEDIIIEHKPVKEKVGKVEVDRMRMKI